MPSNVTTMNGVDCWGESLADRPERSHNGQVWYDEESNTHYYWDDVVGAWWPLGGLIHVDYDFAVHGGAAGAIVLASGVIPAGAVVTGGMIHVLTTVTTASSDAGTLALHVQSAGDLVEAIAVSDQANPWDAGLHDVIPDGTALYSIRATATRSVTLTIGTAAVTAGKFRLSLNVVRGLA